MKSIKLFLILTCISVLGGCSKPTGEPAWGGRWYVDNQTAHEFTITVDFRAVYLEDSVAEVKALTTTKIIGGLEECFVPSYSNGHALITFEFSNGVTHCFEGEKIGHDVRNNESWNVVYEGVQNQIATHTYTFTNDDYERIMALHVDEE